MTQDSADNPPRDDRDGAQGGTDLRTAGVMHDVNQMLMVIIGRAGYLRRYGSPETWAADLESIETAARDASAMLARLGGEGPGGVGAADLRQCVTAAAGVIRPPGSVPWLGPRDSDVPGVWSLDNRVPDDLLAALPAVTVREVLNNLLLNALAVMPDGGRVTVRGEESGARVIMRVQDTGPGVAPDMVDRVFDRGGTTSDEASRGVGLASCRQLLQEHGAAITLDAAAGEGACFVLDLPEAKAVPTAARAVPVRGLTVLVVDDEPAVREMLVDVLAQTDCRVRTVGDGGSVRSEFTAGTYDVALLDNNLPDTSGAALASWLRERDPALPIVVMTGVDREGELARLDPRHVDATAVKPIDLDGLHALLAEAAALGVRRRADGTSVQEETT